MKKSKGILFAALLFMVVGFATISVSLSINADMEMLGDLDDFNVYYSKALVNGEEDPSIVISPTELDFTTVLDTVGTTYTIEYDITNASASFDANITIVCSGSTEYFSVVNDFDVSTPIPAKGTRTGTLSVSKIKTIAGDEQSNNLSCEVIATPVEIEEEGSGEVPTPVRTLLYYEDSDNSGTVTVGDIYYINNEKFNVIGEDDTGELAYLLAYYNLGTNYIQSIDKNGLIFSPEADWVEEETSDIDIFAYSGDVTNYILNYVEYLSGYVEDEYLAGDLISAWQLQDLGCSIELDAYSAELGNCNSSPYKSWLVTEHGTWTKTIFYNLDDSRLYGLVFNGSIVDLNASSESGAIEVRPVITLSKSTITQ